MTLASFIKAGHQIASIVSC